jgi:hypothetical protein
VAAGELVVVVVAVVLVDFVVAGEVEVAVDFVAGDGEVFAEVWAKPTAGRAARRASARIERNGFMDWSFLFRWLEEARPESGTKRARATPAPPAD